jgi:hypothetical protein
MNNESRTTDEQKAADLHTEKWAWIEQHVSEFYDPEFGDDRAAQYALNAAEAFWAELQKRKAQP